MTEFPVFSGPGASVFYDLCDLGVNFDHSGQKIASLRCCVFLKSGYNTDCSHGNDTNTAVGDDLYLYATVTMLYLKGYDIYE